MMVDVLQNHTNVTENVATDILERLQRSPSATSDVSDKNSGDNLQGNVDHDSEVDAPKKRVKRRIKKFSDSDSDDKEQQNNNVKSSLEKNTKVTQGSDNDGVMPVFKRVSHKSRIRKVSEGSSSNSDSSKSHQTGNESGSREKHRFPQVSDSDSDEHIPKSVPPKIQNRSSGSSSESDQALKNEQQQIRMKNKRNKIKDKFKSLMSSRGKDTLAVAENEATKSSNSSEDSDNDETTSSIEKIKQKIKERMAFKPSICDPDTSDEETEGSQQKSTQKQKKERRIKMTSPKPQRMSAKQAMENMQKIKSESNRMLREKEVSLPYHRPKALSLKDIMSRRKPAVSSDGKSFKIKMNDEQLKQYAKMLEDRQKQMMELWQSDSDEENEDKKSGDEQPSSKTIDENSEAIIENRYNIDEPKEIEPTINDKALSADVSADNDKLFDDISQSIIEHSKTTESNKNEGIQVEPAKNEDNVLEEQDSETNVPEEEQDSETNMKLIFNDSETSITEDKLNADKENTAVVNIEISEKNKEHQNSESTITNTEVDSQLISLHYDTENLDTEPLQAEDELPKEITEENTAIDDNIDAEIEAMDVDNGFSDDDMNIEDIDNIIENADILRDIEDKVNSQVLIRDRQLNLKPKLAGAPGMVIDLDDSDNIPKKSGVELLKERFTFFAKLKTPEELEREKERKIKPGNQHLKLKQALEEQMAEQRSLEWAKRLEDEKQQQKEMKELRGENSDDENDIDKLEAKLEGNEENEADVSENEEEEEELLEDDVDMNDKPKAKNPMLDHEAEESDCDENEAEGDGNEQNGENEEEDNDIENGEKTDGDENEEDDDDDEDSSDSESEPEEQPTTKKGRILKAFEDSDDEDVAQVAAEEETSKKSESVDLLGTQPISQDDVLTLAQRHKSVSEDLFSQGSSLVASQKAISQAASGSSENDVDLGTQTFSILDSTNNITADLLNSPTGVICETQPYDDNLDAVAAMCSGSFSQSLPPLPITQFSQSQPIGEDILALCTGKFYENEFVSQVDDNNQMPLGASQEFDSDDYSQNTDTQSKQDNDPEEKLTEAVNDEVIETINKDIANTKVIETNEVNSKVGEQKVVDVNLKSILDELDDPEFDTPRPNKFFCGAKTHTQIITQKEKVESVKKKFIIDSDDDTNDANESEIKKRKKLKKKRPEKRALQISDDEDDEVSDEMVEYESDIEEETTELLVEYDSEENEIEVQPEILKPSKKKHKRNEFFEQEAELTSEDEWVGSGDEDEAGLDRMEREAGDDETFNQGRLQRELGQIHMRDVLDQDKREVRIIQELLFEDGDLGGGGRQRKFKWKNLDGEEAEGISDELRDTQEEEFESEEQWRKQRHERETFLRQMQNNGENNESLNVSINRTTIIKANLMSKTMSMLQEEHNPTEKTEKEDLPVIEKKTASLQSPKKSFSLLQQSYQGSILNRGKGALARLAALATPLAVDDDAPKGKSAAAGSRRNFVFATLTPEPPKVAKRKAEVNLSTPKLVKKMRTEEKPNTSKNSLLDRMKL